MTPGKGSKYREFYDLSGRITCMGSIGDIRCFFDVFSIFFLYFLSIKSPFYILAEAIRTTVVPIRILIRTTVVPITPLITYY